MTVIGNGAGRRSLARHKAALVLLVLAGLLLGGVASAAVYLNSRISAIPRMELDLGRDYGVAPGTGRYERPAPPRGRAAESVNILIAGVDAGETSDIAKNLEDGAWTPGSHRSDVIMLLHISADRRKVYIVSVPRDTWVQIPGYGMDKINAALSYGGPALYVRTLEQFTSVRMDHLVLVDWSGFERLVDRLGGFDVGRPDAPGTTMNGSETLVYVRERETLPRGDLDRIQRQQNVIRDLSGRMVSAGVLLNPVRLNDVLGILTDSLAVDDALTGAEIRRLALSLRNVRSEDITQLTVPVRGFDMIDGKSVVLVDRGGAKRLFGAVTADELGRYVATHDTDVLPPPSQVD